MKVYVFVEDTKVTGYSENFEPNTIEMEVSEDFLANPFKYNLIEGELVLDDTRYRIMKAKEDNRKNLAFLDETDWLVTRHRDQVALGCECSLTNEEFEKLLNDRQVARESIVNK
jgi:hypothetical protein